MLREMIKETMSEKISANTEVTSSCPFKMEIVESSGVTCTSLMTISSVPSSRVASFAYRKSST